MHSKMVIRRRIIWRRRRIIILRRRRIIILSRRIIILSILCASLRKARGLAIEGSHWLV